MKYGLQVTSGSMSEQCSSSNQMAVCSNAVNLYNYAFALVLHDSACYTMSGAQNHDDGHGLGPILPCIIYMYSHDNDCDWPCLHSFSLQKCAEGFAL